MFYERKIKYLDYMQNGERINGAGFVKMEVREDVCNLSIQVSGLPQTASGDREVLLLNEKREELMARIRLETGRGSLLLQGLHRSALGQSGISYDSLMGIRIPLNSGAEVYCVWRREAPTIPGVFGADIAADIAAEAGTNQEEGAAEAATEAAAVEAPIPQVEDRTQTPSVPEPQIPAWEHSAPAREQQIPAWEHNTPACEPQIPVSEHSAPAEETQIRPREGQAPQHRRSPALQESKWEQLSTIYPHVKPFSDERDYISIGPADFVILPEKYYRMANNSFLLHGYYNYEHLILTRVERRGEIRYYIGVPGSFYEREKQVAVMFGFESFECMEEPAQQGDFGYYMMRLEL